jgi:hypothetical protein
MAGRKLARYVTAPDETGRMVTYPPGTEVSAEVAKGIDNPKAWESDDPQPENDEPAKPRARRSSK